LNVIFDLDDTIHDKTASLIRCSYRLIEEFNLNDRCEPSEFSDKFVFENSIIQSKEKVFANLGLYFSLDRKISLEMLEYFDENFHLDAQSFPGVLETLNFLSESGARLGCVTNGRNFFQPNKISACRY